jgi:hypothetical protein
MQRILFFTCHYVLLSQNISMQRRFLFTITILTAVILLSCQKDTGFENKDLYGKWMQKESFDGYAMGGSYTWHSVAPQHADTLQFLSNNEFRMNGPLRKCTGTFIQLADSLEINSNCNTRPEVLRIEKLTNSELITVRAVREGVIKDRYIALE